MSERFPDQIFVDISDGVEKIAEALGIKHNQVAAPVSQTLEGVLDTLNGMHGLLERIAIALESIDSNTTETK